MLRASVRAHPHLLLPSPARRNSCEAEDKETYRLKALFQKRMAVHDLVLLQGANKATALDKEAAVRAG